MKLIKIEETINYLFEDSLYDGYLIVTDEGNYFFGISNSVECCEVFGYLTTEDDFSEFVDKTISSVCLTDTELDIEEFKNLEEMEREYLELEDTNVMFITVYFTDGSKFQMVTMDTMLH